MLRRFAVTDYRGFRDRVELDLTGVRNYGFNPECVNDGTVAKGLIIGSNGSGKTNLGLAIFDIVRTLTSFGYDPLQSDAECFLNGDSDLPYAEFEYEFGLPCGTVEYTYRKTDPDTIVYERMTLDGEPVLLRDGERSDYSAIRTYNAEHLRIDLTDGVIPAVRFIMNNSEQPPGSPIRQMMEFVHGMLYFRSVQDGNSYIGLTRGATSIDDYIIKNGLEKDFEGFVREMTKQDVEYSVVDIPGMTALFVQKTGRKNLRFGSAASSGTKALQLLYYWKQMFARTTFLFMDEFDAFYHYELAESVVRLVCEQKGMQALMTTHNTSLVSNRIMRPDCYFIIEDGAVAPMSDLTEREIRQGNSLEKLYRGGEFQ